MTTVRARLERLEQTAQLRTGKFIVIQVNADALDSDDETIDWASHGVDWNADNLVLRILSFCGLGEPPKVISVSDL